MNKNNSVKILMHVFRGAVCFILLCLVAWLMPRMLAEPKVIGKELGAEAAARQQQSAPVITAPDCVPDLMAGPDLPSVGVRSVGVYFPPNGRFYAMGGRSADGTGNEFVHPFEYSPGTNTWTTKSATYPDNQVNNMACGVLSDSGTSYIYCVGGSAGGATGATNRVFRYNPVTDSITTVATPWTLANTLPGGFTVFNNKLYILGGFDSPPTGNSTNQIWQFTPSPAGWVQKTAVLPVSRGFIPTTTIGSLIYTGGGAQITSGSLTDTTDSFVYNPVADSISAITSIPRATSNTRALNFNSQMWVLGGQFPTPSNEVDIYDPGSNTWTTGAPFPALMTARRNFPTDTDGTGRIWLAGGYDNTGVPVASMEIYQCTSAGSCSSDLRNYVINSIGSGIVPGTTDTGNHGDDTVTTVALPFPYTLYDQTFTSINLSSNGNAQFTTTDTTFTNQCLPWLTHNYTIYPYWDDLYLVNSGFGIFTSISGTAPNRVFNIEWRAQYFPGSGSANFELRLYEGRSRFDVIYGTVTNGNTSATAGVQRDDINFSQAFCNGIGGTASGAQSYTPDCIPWRVVALGDFNHNNKPDYVLYNSQTRRSAIWFLNNNVFVSGAFGPTLPPGWRLADVADFDRDGNLDYALVNVFTRHTAIWYLSGFTFLHGAFGPTLPAGWDLLRVADFNGDGRPDYVLYNAVTRQTAIWYLNNNVFVTGAFGPTLPVGWQLKAVADFDGNGKRDYALYNTATRQTAIWYLNNNVLVSGAFGPTLGSGFELDGAALFNGDTHPDYLLFNPISLRTAIWYLNNRTFLGGAYGPTLPAN
jgi:N-acetylneuraminic acid mutarotase